jgi:hypothetical protein
VMRIEKEDSTGMDGGIGTGTLDESPCE